MNKHSFKIVLLKEGDFKARFLDEESTQEFLSRYQQMNVKMIEQALEQDIENFKYSTVDWSERQKADEDRRSLIVKTCAACKNNVQGNFGQKRIISDHRLKEDLDYQAVTCWICDNCASNNEQKEEIKDGKVYDSYYDLVFNSKERSG